MQQQLLRERMRPNKYNEAMSAYEGVMRLLPRSRRYGMQSGYAAATRRLVALQGS